MFPVLILFAAVPNIQSAPAPQAPAPSAARLRQWREDRFGMFIHWGPVSLKGTEIGWSRGAQVPIEEYDSLYKRFNPTQFNADAWVKVAKAAGMKYIVFTTKHHDGFCMFDTKQTDYNIMRSPFGRDVVKELAAACRKQGIKFGVYHSVCDWHHPDFPLGSPGGSTRKPHPDLDRYEQYLKAEVGELIRNYGPLNTIWFDVPQEFDAKRGQRVVDFARSLQPDILINNRCANPGDYDTPEQEIGRFQTDRPWESCITICNQWAYKPGDTMKSLKECIQTLVRCAGGDGNLLFNVGPMPTGEIEPRQVARLREMGDWLRKYGASVYGTRGGPFRPGSWGCATYRGNSVYLHLLNRASGPVTLPSIPRKIVSSSILTGGQAAIRQAADGIELRVPGAGGDEIDTIVKLNLDGPAEGLEPAASASITTGKTATASNVFLKMPEHSADRAVDGEEGTRWATDSGTHSAWLEVDLGRSTAFNRARIVQEKAFASRIRRFELQARDGGDWTTVLNGTTMSAVYGREFPPVSARYVRLNVLDATEGPTINEFQLFAPPELNLVPYPKGVRVHSGGFTVPKRMAIAVCASANVHSAAKELEADMEAVCPATFTTNSAKLSGKAPAWRLEIREGRVATSSLPHFPAPADKEGYSLRVTRSGVVVDSTSEAGLLNGISTLRQLVRANMRGREIPGVKIEDWPSLRNRGFLDDITRGPSPTPAQLKREASFAAYLRMNVLTYYMEHQFAYRKHPEIGPKDGSLTPGDLRAWARFAEARGVELVGCQQSFGHFGNILKYPQYSALRETADVLNPTSEGTYRLLDDLYSEQAPLLASKRFLVCCDETYGLGTGPAKALVGGIGIGGVYARHMQRIHDLITGKYGKQMLMWGDIILQHPDHLSEIPKDAVMLSWGYDARANFDDSILPFKKAGFQFMVCPGVSNWSRILPDFATSTTNIHNYVRDGAKHGAIGMLNTTWDDDGETLFGPNEYGLAFGAECAWNGSTTPVEDFNRRIGAVLFGEKGGHFGQAIALLSRVHALPGYDGMTDSRFWHTDENPKPGTEDAVPKQARELLALVEPAIKHLHEARREARFNRQVLDTYLFGAERMRFIARRQLAYLPATESSSSSSAIRELRDDLRRLRSEYIRLWQIENRPYALDNVLARYDAAIAQYDRLLEHAGH